MIGLIWNCRGVSKKGIATKVKDLYSKYKAYFVGLQETMKNRYSDKFFRLIDPHQNFLPGTGCPQQVNLVGSCVVPGKKNLT
jgi:hypothetical protein